MYSIISHCKGCCVAEQNYCEREPLLRGEVGEVEGEDF